MQIEPQATAFAKRYARGEAQVVWTTLVSDLETPVSAFLKIADGRPMSFLLESVEGGAVRGRYSIIGLDPDLIWRTVAGRAEIKRAARALDQRLHAVQRGAARCAARADRREPDRAPRHAAADGGRHFRLSRLRHGAADGRAAAAQSRPDRHPRRHAGAADHRGRVRRGEGRHHRGHAGSAGKRSFRGDRLHAGERAALRHHRCARCAAGACPAQRQGRPAHGMAVLQHRARRIRADGQCRQGIHRGRRHFSGGAVAAFRGAVRAAAVLALSRAAAGQSRPLPLFPRLRRLFRSPARAPRFWCGCARAR